MVELNKTLVLGMEEEEGGFIVFVPGWPFLPVGPHAHEVLRLSHLPVRTGYPESLRSTPCARGSKDPVRMGYPET